ncbi:galactokinase [Cellulomonas sp. Root137]|uniref:galactokinase n=1 Tax=Cellulomonas sp. Root137 TaxID=1736459 RepID=UPI0007022AD9|nr:galactokinase [Cellulomonas sp. Root137]KQY47386.1 galactokinase [Cellulomonas sp. Root137]
MTPEWLEAWTPAEGADRAAAVFRARFASEPDGTWSAPGRVNLIGEHTDYNGGLCLPIALPHRTYIALRRRDDDTVRLVSAQEPAGLRTIELADVAPGTVEGWAGYVAGVAWALRQAGHTVSGFDVAVDSCVPYGAGLSSSAALEASVAVALDAVFALGLAGSDDGRATLASFCVRAENEIAGAPTGGMDQAAALRAQAGNALLLDCLDGSVRHVPFDLAAHGLALLVVDTRAEHALVDGQYAARRASCEAAAERLGVGTLREISDDPRGLEWALGKLDDDVQVRRVRHVVNEIDRVTWFVALLDAGEVGLVGTLMNQSHASLRDDYEVSCRELDLVVDTARETGAAGARMTGGGFGGSAIALVGADDVDQVAQAVADAFAAEGLRAPAFLVATAAGAAG